MENLIYHDVFDVEFCPTVNIDGIQVISTIDDATSYGIYYKIPGFPANCDAVFDDADDALWHMLYDEKYRTARKWYHGSETRMIIAEEDDVFVALADNYLSKMELNALAKKLGIDPAISYVLVRRVVRRRTGNA